MIVLPSSPAPSGGEAAETSSGGPSAAAVFAALLGDALADSSHAGTEKASESLTASVEQLTAEPSLDMTTTLDAALSAALTEEVGEWEPGALATVLAELSGEAEEGDGAVLAAIAKLAEGDARGEDGPEDGAEEASKSRLVRPDVGTRPVVPQDRDEDADGEQTTRVTVGATSLRGSSPPRTVVDEADHAEDAEGEESEPARVQPSPKRTGASEEPSTEERAPALRASRAEPALPQASRSESLVRADRSALAARVADIAERLESAPPPRQMTVEVGELRLSVSLRADGAVRVAVVGEVNQAAEQAWRRELAEALAGRGMDLEMSDPRGHAQHQSGNGQKGWAPQRSPVVAARPTSDDGIRL